MKVDNKELLHLLGSTTQKVEGYSYDLSL